MMDRRDNSDPYDIGVTLGWAWAWPLNRRILYNRASARPDGTPWDEPCAGLVERRTLGRCRRTGLPRGRAAGR